MVDNDSGYLKGMVEQWVDDIGEFKQTGVCPRCRRLMALRPLDTARPAYQALTDTWIHCGLCGMLRRAALFFPRDKVVRAKGELE